MPQSNRSIAKRAMKTIMSQPPWRVFNILHKYDMQDECRKLEKRVRDEQNEAEHAFLDAIQDDMGVNADTVIEVLKYLSR